MPKVLPRWAVFAFHRLRLNARLARTNVVNYYLCTVRFQVKRVIKKKNKTP